MHREDERLDPFSATCRKRGERGACKRCVRSGRRQEAQEAARQAGGQTRPEDRALLH